MNWREVSSLVTADSKVGAAFADFIDRARPLGLTPEEYEGLMAAAQAWTDLARAARRAAEARVIAARGYPR